MIYFPSLNECKLIISMDIWSLFRESNRKDVLMTYLCDLKLISAGSENIDMPVIDELAKQYNLKNIVEILNNNNKLQVTNGRLDFYEGSCVVLPDSSDIFLSDNNELAEINRKAIQPMIDGLTEQFGCKMSEKIEGLFD
jgi:hypothetical protein